METCKFSLFEICEIYDIACLHYPYKWSLPTLWYMGLHTSGMIMSFTIPDPLLENLGTRLHPPPPLPASLYKYQKTIIISESNGLSLWPLLRNNLCPSMSVSVFRGSLQHVTMNWGEELVSNTKLSTETSSWQLVAVKWFKCIIMTTSISSNTNFQLPAFAKW